MKDFMRLDTRVQCTLLKENEISNEKPENWEKAVSCLYLLKSKLTKVGTDKRQRALIQYGKNAVQIASKDYHRYVYNKHNLPRGKHKVLDDSMLSETPFILEGDLPANYQTLTDVQLSEILDPLD